ncbi:Fc.00g006360.m01.CDS01 [Cosmosporella sp. VM-42]
MLNPRYAARAFAMGIGPAACVGSFAVHRRTIRCDSASFVSSPPARQRSSSSWEPSPETVRQVSGGSLAGFGTGLVVAIFSRTLAILGSLLALSIHIASRYGWDVSRLVPIDKFPGGSSIWKKYKGKPWFTLSFIVTFMLAAFAHL